MLVITNPEPQGLAAVDLNASRTGADRAEAALQDLPVTDRQLAMRLLEIISAEYLIGPADRGKIRRAMRVLAYCAAVIVAANGPHAREARDGFVGALDRGIRRMLGL